MKQAIITKVFKFEAAHHLPGHRGKCARPHGHSYRLEISLRGPLNTTPGQSEEGMVMDFDDLKKLVNTTILEQIAGSDSFRHQGGVDHNDLNVLTGIRTTAENLVHWIWERLVAGGISDEMLYRVRLWETENGYVEITQDER